MKDTEAKARNRKKASKSVKKDAQLLIRINAQERDAFISVCEQLDTSAARELRGFIRDFIQKNHRDMK